MRGTLFSFLVVLTILVGSASGESLLFTPVTGGIRIMDDKAAEYSVYEAERDGKAIYVFVSQGGKIVDLDAGVVLLAHGKGFRREGANVRIDFENTYEAERSGVRLIPRESDLLVQAWWAGRRAEFTVPKPADAGKWAADLDRARAPGNLGPVTFVPVVVHSPKVNGQSRELSVFRGEAGGHAYFLFLHPHPRVIDPVRNCVVNAPGELARQVGSAWIVNMTDAAPYDKSRGDTLARPDGVLVSGEYPGTTVSFTVRKASATDGSGLTIAPLERRRLLVPAEYPSIQAAIDAADYGEEIVVSPGTYRENLDFKGKQILVRSADPADPVVVAATVVDGSDAGPVVVFAGGEGSRAGLDGLTLTNGRSARGGGIRITAASPTISRCVIHGNAAEEAGGGVWCGGGSEARISNSIVNGNHCVSGVGGGIALDESAVTVTHVTLHANEAGSGGGIHCRGSAATITNCIVTGSVGGGIVSDEGTPPILTYTNLHGNTAANHAGFAPGTGVISQDPRYANAAGGDFHLKSMTGRRTGDQWILDDVVSPCVDAADPSSSFEEEPAPNGGRANLGAYGNSAQASKQAPPAHLPDVVVVGQAIATFTSGSLVPTYTTPTYESVRKFATPGGTAAHTVRIRNLGTHTQTFTVGVEDEEAGHVSGALWTCYGGVSGAGRWSLTFTHLGEGGGNVSREVRTTGWTTPSLATGEHVDLRVQVGGTALAWHRMKLTARPAGDADVVDGVEIRTWTAPPGGGVSRADLMVNTSVEDGQPTGWLGAGVYSGSGQSGIFDSVGVGTTWSGPTVSRTGSRLVPAVAYVRVQNDGNRPASWQVLAVEFPSLEVTCSAGTTVSFSGFVTPTLMPGETFDVRVRLKPHAGLGNGTTKRAKFRTFGAGDHDDVAVNVTVQSTDRAELSVWRAGDDSEDPGRDLPYGGRATYHVRLTNTTDMSQGFKVRLESDGDDSWELKMYSAVTGGTLLDTVPDSPSSDPWAPLSDDWGKAWSTPTIAMGQSRTFRIEVRHLGGASTFSTCLHAQSSTMVSTSIWSPGGSHQISYHPETQYGLSFGILDHRPDLRIGVAGTGAATGDDVYETAAKTQRAKVMKVPASGAEFEVSLQSDTGSQRVLVLRATVEGVGWHVRFLEGTKDVTEAVLASGFTTDGLRRDETESIRLLVTPVDVGPVSAGCRVALTCASADEPEIVDVAEALVGEPGAAMETSPYHGSHATIQAAIDAASAWEVITIAAGTWKENLRVDKEITLRSVDPSNDAVVAATVLDGSGKGPTLTITAGAVIEGLTITGGRAKSGGGVLITKGKPVLRHCVIRDNLADERGGGVACVGTVAALEHCVIATNEAAAGGGVFCLSASPSLSFVTMYKNTARRGAAVFAEDGSPVIVNSIVAFSVSGAAIETAGRGTPDVAFCNVFTPGGRSFAGFTPKETLLSVDPQFADPGGGDFHLRSFAGRLSGGQWVQDSVHSPLIDAGRKVGGSTLETEPNGGAVNLGAYGDTPAASRTYVLPKPQLRAVQGSGVTTLPSVAEVEADQKVTRELRIKNTGLVSDTYRLTLDEVHDGFTLAVFDGTTDVTSALLAGSLVTPQMPAGGHRIYRVEITPGSGVLGGITKSFVFRAARSVGGSADLVNLRVRVELVLTPDVSVRLPGQTSWTGDDVYWMGVADAPAVSKSVDLPESQATFEFRLENQGNGPGSFRLTEYWVPPPEYCYMLTSQAITSGHVPSGPFGDITVYPGVPLTLTLTVSCPGRSTPVTLPVGLKVRIAGEDEVRDRARVTLVIEDPNALQADLSIDGIGAGALAAQGALQSLGKTVASGQTSVFQLRVALLGSQSGEVVVKGPTVPAGYTVSYFDAATGGNDITSLVSGAGWTGPTLSPGTSQALRMEITAGSNRPDGEHRYFPVESWATSSPSLVDEVKASVTVLNPDPRPDLLVREEGDGPFTGGNAYGGGTIQRIDVTAGSGDPAWVTIRIQNDGNVSDRFLVTGPANPHKWTYSWFSADTPITDLVTGSGWWTPYLDPGEFVEIRLKVACTSGLTAMEAVTTTATSERDASRLDQVTARVTPTGS